MGRTQKEVERGGSSWTSWVNRGSPQIAGRLRGRGQAIDGGKSYIHIEEGHLQHAYVCQLDRFAIYLPVDTQRIIGTDHRYHANF